MDETRTLVRIAVSDPLPMFHRGVADVMRDTGHAVASPKDLLAWIANGGDRAVVLLTLLRPADWTLLATIQQERPATTTLIAVIENGDLALSVRALGSGAVGVMAREADFDTVRDVLAAAASGRSLLPVEVVHALTATSDAQRHPVPPEVEISWIRQLTQGLTVARLAERAGYSERMMFRLLRDLYLRWGVASRTEAIIHARDNGWL